MAAALLTACDGAEPVIEQTVVLNLTPADQRFGDVPVGIAVQRNVIVRNSGNAPWVPAAPPVIAGDGFSWRRGCEDPVEPGGTCEAFVTFAPVDEAASSGSFTVHNVDSNGVDIVSSVTFSGTGVAPSVLVSPASIDFGLVLVGNSRSEAIRIENTGSTTVVADIVVVDDNGSGAFSFLDGDRAPLRLAPGTSTQIGVTFRPAIGGPSTARLVIELCGAQCGPAVVVSGSASAPRIEATPRAIDFGDVVVGAVVTQNIKIENVGDGALEVIAVELEAADDDVTIGVQRAVPAVLNDDDSLEIVVRYAPHQGRTALDAMVVVSSSDPLSPSVFIPIDGATPGPGLQVLPEVAHFGRLAAGESRDLSMVVRSIGAAPVDVTGIRIEGDGFSLVSVPGPTTLDRFESLQFLARATATPRTVTAGGGSARVVVQARGLDDVVATLAFFAGTSGCVPVASIAHADLGNVQLRSGTTGAVVIDNLGDADCVLQDVIEGGGGFPFDSDFSVSANGARVVGVGDSGVVDFGYFAARIGVRTAMVELRFSGVPASLFVSASARGIDGELSISPAALAFGPVPGNCGDVTGRAVASNTGATSLTVIGMTLTPSDAPFALDFARLPRQLVPGATSLLKITALTSVAPVGPSTATATFTTDLGITASVSLSLLTTASRATVTERFTAAAAVNAVDILFVVDNSGSMAAYQQLLADNFAAFFADALAATERTQDFHVGVTTTDVLSVGAANGGLVGAPSILDRGTLNLGERFASNVLVGVEGTGLELGLEAMRLAIDNPANVGFIRSGAALSVIVISDEEDSGDLIDFLPDPALSRSPDEYVALLSSLKAGSVDNAPVLVSGVLTPGQAARYEAVIDAFHGSVLDISRPDWGERLSELGFDTFALSRTFGLQSDADPRSIVVTVDGVATTDFVWDPERRAVILDDSPDRGAAVVVSYVAGC